MKKERELFIKKYTTLYNGQVENCVSANLLTFKLQLVHHTLHTAKAS